MYKIITPKLISFDLFGSVRPNIDKIEKHWFEKKANFRSISCQNWSQQKLNTNIYKNKKCTPFQPMSFQIWSVLNNSDQ